MSGTHSIYKVLLSELHMAGFGLHGTNYFDLTDVLPVIPETYYSVIVVVD